MCREDRVDEATEVIDELVRMKCERLDFGARRNKLRHHDHRGELLASRKLLPALRMAELDDHVGRATRGHDLELRATLEGRDDRWPPLLESAEYKHSNAMSPHEILD